MRNRIVRLLAAAAIGSAPAWAGAAPAPPQPDRAFARGALDRGEPRVEARLLVDPRLDPAAGARVGVHLQLDPGWHVYGREPGETGLPTRVRWTLAGATFGPIAWPAEKRFVDAGGDEASGYDGELLLASPVSFASGAAPRGVLRAEVDLLACATKCIPDTLALQLDLDAALSAVARDEKAAGEVAALFARFEALAASAPAEPAPAPAAPRPAAGLGLAHALVLALLGGLVLNLMPCVLPVLAIKLFSLAELSAGSRREAAAQGLAYTAGVLASMLALALLVAAMRAAGTSVGWGFQFQDPRFVLAISALLVVFAMNLFGVFEFAMPARLASLGSGATGTRRSALEGLLAVALATPCSAPFLGTAVGFAFAGSIAVMIAVLAAVGLGLALPFLLASLFPPLARWMPRAGAWMLHLRAGLGFALLATVVWLLWILGRTAGADGVVGACALLVALGFAVWLASVWRPSGLRWPALGTASAVLVFALVGVNAVAIVPGAVRPAADAPREGWQPFAPERVRASLDAGNPVLVYFTADWCITCKYNERFVLADERVRAALRRRNVALFEADWTKRDERIRAELARFGRAGVPLCVIHEPWAPERPIVLPELLSVEAVLEALDAKAPRQEG
jgi:thiol:disulfide interchange protein DsbD